MKPLIRVHDAEMQVLQQIWKLRDWRDDLVKQCNVYRQLGPRRYLESHPDLVEQIRMVTDMLDTLPIDSATRRYYGDAVSRFQPDTEFMQNGFPANDITFRMWTMQEWEAVIRRKLIVHQQRQTNPEAFRVVCTVSEMSLADAMEDLMARRAGAWDYIRDNGENAQSEQLRQEFRGRMDAIGRALHRLPVGSRLRQQFIAYFGTATEHLAFMFDVGLHLDDWEFQLLESKEAVDGKLQFSNGKFRVALDDIGQWQQYDGESLDDRAERIVVDWMQRDSLAAMPRPFFDACDVHMQLRRFQKFGEKVVQLGMSEWSLWRLFIRLCVCREYVRGATSDLERKKLMQQFANEHEQLGAIISLWPDDSEIRSAVSIFVVCGFWETKHWFLTRGIPLQYFAQYRLDESDDAVDDHFAWSDDDPGFYVPLARLCKGPKPGTGSHFIQRLYMQSFIDSFPEGSPHSNALRPLRENPSLSGMKAALEAVTENPGDPVFLEQLRQWLRGGGKGEPPVHAYFRKESE